MKSIIMVITMAVTMFVGMVLVDTHVSAPVEEKQVFSRVVNDDFDKAMRAQDDYIAEVLNK